MQQRQIVPLGYPYKSIQTPQKCICIYDSTISAYRCSFEIKNITDHIVYLSICSTFLHYMELQSVISYIEAHETKTISVKLRPPNQIYPYQFIGICYSDNIFSQQFAIFNPDCIKSYMRLQFDTEIIEDAQIDFILRQYSQNEHKEAIQLFKQSKYKQAIEKSEESFTLYRKNLSCLVTMSDSLLKLGNHSKACSKIELILYMPSHPDYFKAVVIKIEASLVTLTSKQIHRKLSIIKSMMHTLKQANQNTIVDEAFEIRANQAMSQLQNLRQQLISMQHDGLFNQLLENAVHNFNKSDIKDKFKDRLQFSEYLNRMIRSTHKNEDQTPQYALDPINYQIYLDPVITPAGLSYEKQFMANFLKKHGPQDPFTRAYLDPASIVNNITLKILVRNNPNLPRWIKYEESATRI